jgi:hypothetical protein
MCCRPGQQYAQHACVAGVVLNGAQTCCASSAACSIVCGSRGATPAGVGGSDRGPGVGGSMPGSVRAQSDQQPARRSGAAAGARVSQAGVGPRTDDDGDAAFGHRLAVPVRVLVPGLRLARLVRDLACARSVPFPQPRHSAGEPQGSRGRCVRRATGEGRRRGAGGERGSAPLWRRLRRSSRSFFSVLEAWNISTGGICAGRTRRVRTVAQTPPPRYRTPRGVCVRSRWCDLAAVDLLDHDAAVLREALIGLNVPRRAHARRQRDIAVLYTACVVYHAVGTILYNVTTACPAP